MKRLEFAPGAGVVIVAHPDDETIWMGGTMLMARRVKWTIIALSRSNDPDRAPKFRRAAKRYNAKAIISNLEDEGIMNLRASIPEIAKRLKKHLPKAPIDYLFTHNRNGEYGHPRHKGVHLAVKKLLVSGALRPRQAFFFNYEFNERKNSVVPQALGTDYYSALSLQFYKSKKEIIQTLYGFGPRSFESKSSGRLETFSLARL